VNAEMDKILIVDDSISFLNDIEALLDGTFRIRTAKNAYDCLKLLEEETFSTVLLDLHLPDMYGTEVLKKIHSDIDPFLPVFIITNYDEIDNVVEAMRCGACDFIPKNFNLNLLAEKIKKALERRRLELSNRALQTDYLESNQLVFSSSAMSRVNFEISRFAKLGVDVLLYGETGVGKDLIASQIHTRSERYEKPFIPVSIRSLSNTLIESELFGYEKGAFSGADRLKIGKFEAADKGTVYIPEISSLSETVQLKLLHFMQYKSISRVGQDPTKSEIKLDVRLIMATNDDLADLVKQGKMREDFYHRISGVTLAIPPLRERRSDIELLSDHFIQMYSHMHPQGTCNLAPDVIEAFQEYHWPGNVRELSNSIKSAIIYAEDTTLTLNLFPNVINDPLGPKRTGNGFIHLDSDDLPELKEAEHHFKQSYFKRLWEVSGQDINKTAQLAGITSHATRRILKNLGLR
jgi:DNA-binding NtrC family response regulator